MYSTFFLRVDAVRSPGELFAVERSTGPGANASAAVHAVATTRRCAARPASFTDAFAMLRPSGTHRRAAAVDIGPRHRELLPDARGPAALGRALTPEDDERLAGRPVIVLSHRGWNKLFAGDPTVIGRHVRVNGPPYEIVGVMPEDFRAWQSGRPTTGHHSRSSGSSAATTQAERTRSPSMSSGG